MYTVGTHVVHTVRTVLNMNTECSIENGVLNRELGVIHRLGISIWGRNLGLTFDNIKLVGAMTRLETPC